MLASDPDLLGLPNGPELYATIALHDRAMAWLTSIPVTDRPARQRAVRICQASSRLWNVRSARFVGHFTRLP